MEEALRTMKTRAGEAKELHGDEAGSTANSALLCPGADMTEPIQEEKTSLRSDETGKILTTEQIVAQTFLYTESLQRTIA